MKSERGFTLIEIMITVEVMTTCLLGLLYANTKMQQSGNIAFERAVAMQHANQVIENMRNSAVTSLATVTTAFPNNGTVASSNYTQSSTNESLPSEVVTASYVSTTADPLDATVTVTWLAGGVRTVSKSVRTLITRR